jgi:hypothetical protein
MYIRTAPCISSCRVKVKLCLHLNEHYMIKAWFTNIPRTRTSVALSIPVYMYTCSQLQAWCHIDLWSSTSDAFLPSFKVYKLLSAYSYCVGLLSSSSSLNTGFPRCSFPWTSGAPHHSVFKLQTVTLSLVCAMFPGGQFSCNESMESLFLHSS